MTILRGYFLVLQCFFHYPPLNIEPTSWVLTNVCAAHFLNKYTWVPWQIRKKKTTLLDLSGTRLAVLLYGRCSWGPCRDLRLSFSASYHDISGKLKRVAPFTCLLFLWVQLLWNKISDRYIYWVLSYFIITKNP